MSDFRTFVIEKVLLMGSILLVMPFPNTRHDSLNTKKDTIVKPVKMEKKSSITSDSLSVDKIIEEAKMTAEQYAESLKYKEEVERKSLELARKEVANLEKSNKLLEKIIKKYESKESTELLSKVIKDSTCIKSTKYLLKKSRVCTEWQIEYFVMQGNKKILLETFKRRR